MATYIAIYHGPTFVKAKLVAACTDSKLVADAASFILADSGKKTLDHDPVLHALNSGRDEALRVILAGLSTDE